jgi:hypothetical protein
MIDEKLKAQIDAMDYHSLLHLWRTAPAGNPFFEGETGKYYAEEIERKRQAVGQTAAVRTSKIIGWQNR